MEDEDQLGSSRLDSLHVIVDKVFDSVEEALSDLEQEIASKKTYSTGATACENPVV